MSPTQTTVIGRSLLVNVRARDALLFVDIKRYLRRPVCKDKCEFVNGCALLTLRGRRITSVTMLEPLQMSEEQESEFLLEEARKDFLFYVQVCDQNYIAEPVHALIARKLQEVLESTIAGIGKRLIITIPPRIGKTRLTAVELPSWGFGKYPGLEFRVAGYSDDIPIDSSRKCRDRLMDEETYHHIFKTRIAQGNSRVKLWGTNNGGQYQAVGIGAGLTGRGADCLLGSTLLETDSGQRTIESISVAEMPVKVLAYDDGTKLKCYKSVEAVAKRDVDGLVRITTASGIVIDATDNHPFYSWEGSGAGYIRAADLTVGSQLLSMRSERDAVASVEHVAGRFTVWNIQVAGTQNFFANGILTHNCLIIDDPIKNYEEAHSPVKLDACWNWYWSTARTRLSPRGSVVIIMTRWSPEDIVGRMLDPERLKKLDTGAIDLSREQFEVINLPALADDPKDLLGRKLGESISPKRWPKDNLLLTKATTLSYVWSALYEGRPTLSGGNYIPVGMFRVVEREEVPPGLRWARAWDLATDSKEANDETASIAGALGPDGMLYLRDMIHGRWKWPEARERIKQTAAAERIFVGVEAVGGFKAAYSNLVEVMPPGIMCMEYNVDRDKLTRALPWISMLAKKKNPLDTMGQVALVRGDWITDFLIQCERFTGTGKEHDDYVDAVSGTYAMLAGGMQFLIPVNINDRLRRAQALRQKRSLDG